MRGSSRRRRILPALFVGLTASAVVACGSPGQPSGSPSLEAAPSSGATVPVDLSPGPTQVSPILSPRPLLSPAENPTASTCAETGDAALSPTQQPGRPNGWPVMLGDWAQFPVFGPDGTMYQVQDMKLVAIDATGHEPAGWPMPLSIPPVSDNGYAPTDVSIGPDGTVYVMGGNLIYAFHPDGTQVSGWPYRAPVNSECPACTAALLPVAQGLYTDIDPGQIALLGTNGVPLPGWPVPLPKVSDPSYVELWSGPDETLYVEDQHSDTIYAFGSDGAAKPGWPLQGWSGMTFDPGGRIYVWKYKFGAPPGARYSGPAIETQIGALDPAGHFYTGWPMTFNGPVAQPVFAPDGTVYMTRGTSYGPGSATPPSPGGTILAFDPNGKPKPGWPVSLPAGTGLLAACLASLRCPLTRRRSVPTEPSTSWLPRATRPLRPAQSSRPSTRRASCWRGGRARFHPISSATPRPAVRARAG